MAIYKSVEWQSADGVHWYCNDTSNIGAGSSSYWHPARILGISLEDFAKLLIEEYNAEVSFPNQKVLIYSWKKQSDMRKFKNFINAQARKANYQV